MTAKRVLFDGSSRRAWIAAMALVLVGCGSSASATDSPPPTPPGATDAERSGPAVFLATRVEGENLVVDLVARGAADVHGAAFRLRWDPARLSFVSATTSDAWSPEVLALAKEGLPGELAVAWTELGAGAAIDAREDKRLGTITFSSRGPDPSSASPLFRADRSKLVDPKGARIDAAWRERDPRKAP